LKQRSGLVTKNDLRKSGVPVFCRRAGSAVIAAKLVYSDTEQDFIFGFSRCSIREDSL